MKKNFGPKAWLYPMPVLIIGTYNENGTPNLMNAAWGGISLETQISICVDGAHKTTENLLKTGAFTVHVADAAHIAACDYVGCVSGNDCKDKFAKTGFHAQKSAFVNAPVVEELPMVLECKVVSYDKETCRLVGEIANVGVDDRVLTDGEVDVAKLDPVTYDPVHHLYYRLGEKAAAAFKAGLALK